MSSLDDKLRDAIVATNRDFDKTQRFKMNELIDQIKQAFVDERYSQLQRVGYNPDAESYSERFPQVMTGQAFYDRFITETGKFPANTPNYPQIIEAARKAAGLE